MYVFAVSFKAVPTDPFYQRKTLLFDRALFGGESEIKCEKDGVENILISIKSCD